MERWSVWFIEVLAAPALATAVSIVYFSYSPKGQPMRQRLVASSHGFAIAVLYSVAWYSLISGTSRPYLLAPFVISLIAPCSLMAASFLLYKGPMKVHWLQGMNIVCLLWTGFAGSMLITGQSP